MQAIGLGSLLAPISQEEFFDSYWPKKHLFIPPSPNKLNCLFDLPQLQSLQTLIAARVLKVRACLPDFDDEYSSILLEPGDALKVFRNNMTLVFDSMQSQSETIAGFLKNVRSDLGLVTGSENDLTQARAIVYATPAGGRTRLHFDANANFVFQLKGTKRWCLAPNISVENPTDRYTSCTGEIGVALEKQCHAQLLEELPKGSLEFLLEPGAVLFVPRGYWHETTTEDDSISLNLTFSQPTWADIFTKSIHELLLQSADWRELADGIEASDLGRKEKAIARFEVLVRQFARELPNISGKELLTEASLLS